VVSCIALTVPICTVLTTAVIAALRESVSAYQQFEQTYTIPNPNKITNPSLTWSLTCRCQSIMAGYNASAVSKVAPKLPWKYAKIVYVSLPSHEPVTLGFQILFTGLHCAQSRGMKMKLTIQLLAAQKYKMRFPLRLVPSSWRMN